MKQKYYVIDAMRANGGYATLQQLNMLVDFSTWKTKHLRHLSEELFRKMMSFSEYNPDCGH